MARGRRGAIGRSATAVATFRKEAHFSGGQSQAVRDAQGRLGRQRAAGSATKRGRTIGRRERGLGPRLPWPWPGIVRRRGCFPIGPWASPLRTAIVRRALDIPLSACVERGSLPLIAHPPPRAPSDPAPYPARPLRPRLTSPPGRPRLIPTHTSPRHTPPTMSAATVSDKGDIKVSELPADVEIGDYPSPSGDLHRAMSARQVAMLAIAGTIGTGQPSPARLSTLMQGYPLETALTLPSSLPTTIRSLLG